MTVPRLFQFLLFGFVLQPLISNAEVALPAVFGNQMVLQRGIPLPVWGTADPGEKVQVTIGDHNASTVADKDGKWEIKIGPLEASSDPLEMTVQASNKLSFQDILVGDVWICSGQSNMEWPLSIVHNGAEAVSNAANPQIRLFTVQKKVAFDPETDCQGEWTVCGPDTVPNFSAVGYFFGKEIQESQNVPIGLIGTYWGGTSAQAWTSSAGLKTDPVIAYYAEQFEQTKANLPELMESYQTVTMPKYQAELDTWNTMAAAAKADGQEPDPVAPPNQPGSPDQNPGIPTVLYNGMIAPILPYGIKGAIWYQGESNAGLAEEYATLFPALITDWRARWTMGDFPFLFVQLAAFAPGGDAWAALRDSQTKTLSLPNTGMAVTIDIGEPENIHPGNKLEVGHRLALAARANVYGEDLEFSGPMFESMDIEANQVRLSFSHAKDGLKIGSNPVKHAGDEVKAPLDHLVGFEIAGPEGDFVEASATIDGNTVVVSSDSVTAPAAVRYGWAAYPEVNLYNSADLPAVPFATDRE